MKIHWKLMCCLLPLVLLGVGCKKGSDAKQNATTSATTPVPANTSGPAGSASSPEAGVLAAETTAKLAGAEWAMKQDEIKNDPHGQWAIQATASSSYNDAQGTAAWSANQVTGAPNVEKYADDGAAWAPKTPDAGIEWLDLKYSKPVHATEVRVRESCGSGAVVKIELLDEQGGAHLAWGGNDPATELNYLIVKFPKTAFKTARVKVTLATNVVSGWNEIDAVQLVGTDQ